MVFAANQVTFVSVVQVLRRLRTGAEFKRASLVNIAWGFMVLGCYPPALFAAMRPALYRGPFLAHEAAKLHQLELALRLEAPAIAPRPGPGDVVTLLHDLWQQGDAKYRAKVRLKAPVGPVSILNTGGQKQRAKTVVSVSRCSQANPFRLSEVTHLPLGRGKEAVEPLLSPASCLPTGDSRESRELILGVPAAVLGQDEPGRPRGDVSATARRARVPGAAGRGGARGVRGRRPRARHSAPRAAHRRRGGRAAPLRRQCAPHPARAHQPQAAPAAQARVAPHHGERSGARAVLERSRGCHCGCAAAYYEARRQMRIIIIGKSRSNRMNVSGTLAQKSRRFEGC